MSAGIAVFIIVVVVDALALLVDPLLPSLGLATITSAVRGGNWLLGAATIMLQLLGGIGLACHYWGVCSE